MSKRRMFSSAIVQSDPFLDMPSSTQALYFQLGMEADDEGFVYPQKVMRSINASQDDLRILKAKRFVIEFESGVIVLKHWGVNNRMRRDRVLASTHTKERLKLSIDSGGVYREIDDMNAASRPPISKVVSKIDSGGSLRDEIRAISEKKRI